MVVARKNISPLLDADIIKELETSINEVSLIDNDQ